MDNSSDKSWVYIANFTSSLTRRWSRVTALTWKGYSRARPGRASWTSQGHCVSAPATRPVGWCWSRTTIRCARARAAWPARSWILSANWRKAANAPARYHAHRGLGQLLALPAPVTSAACSSTSSRYLHKSTGTAKGFGRCCTRESAGLRDYDCGQNMH